MDQPLGFGWDPLVHSSIRTCTVPSAVLIPKDRRDWAWASSQGLDPGSTGRLMRNAKFCGKNSPHRPFSAYLSRCAIACVLRKLQLHRDTDVSCRRHDHIALPDVRCVVTAGLDGGASLRLLCLLLDTMELFLLKLVFPVVQLRACAAQASVSS